MFYAVQIIAELLDVPIASLPYLAVSVLLMALILVWLWNDSDKPSEDYVPEEYRYDDNGPLK